MRTNHSPISHDIQYKIDHQKIKKKKSRCLLVLYLYMFLYYYAKQEY